MMKLILPILAFVLFPFGQNKAQTSLSDQLRFRVTMVDEETNKPIKGMTLTVHAEGEKAQVYSTDSLGKCPQIDLQLSKCYRIRMVGKNYLSKIIEIDGREFPEEDRYAKGLDMQLETKMVEKSVLGACPANELQEIENTVFTRLRYNKKSRALDWDIQAVERIKNRIDDCRVN